jgi:hypothetical protein
MYGFLIEEGLRSVTPSLPQPVEKIGVHELMRPPPFMEKQ